MTNVRIHELLEMAILLHPDDLVVLMPWAHRSVQSFSCFESTLKWNYIYLVIKVAFKLAARAT